MDRLFGRASEQEQLDRLLVSGQAEFIALYGRRRVGKTFLVKEHLRGKITFYVSGVIDEDAEAQKKSFQTALEEHGAPAPRGNAWMDYFLSLKQFLQLKVSDNKPCIVFIDEIPCLDTPRSGFIGALDHFWNTWASDHTNMKLIVCGSATSWIIKNLVDSHGGLHNRLTATIHLHPFTLKETEDYLKQRHFNWNRNTIAQLYMIFGGVPFYLSLLSPKETLAQAIDRLYFQRDATLENEYKRLTASLFRSPEPYYRIIETLAQHQQGITREEISQLTGLGTGGNLTRMLTELEHCDFIRSYYTRGRKVRINSCFYQLTDLFSLFHLHFRKKGINDPHFWENNINTPQVNTWLGLAFERIVLQHIEQVKKALGIERMGVNYYAWRSRTSQPASQIDLVLDRADNIVNICEMKYAKDAYLMTEEDEVKMRRRQSTFLLETRSRQATRPTMITPFGLQPNTHSSEITDEISLDDLFK